MGRPAGASEGIMFRYEGQQQKAGFLISTSDYLFSLFKVSINMLDQSALNMTF